MFEGSKIKGYIIWGLYIKKVENFYRKLLFEFDQEIILIIFLYVSFIKL